MSNEVLQTIKNRRSVRQYKEDSIPEEILDQILEAGTYAATGQGKQSPIMIAVTNKEVRDQLSRLNASIMGSTNDPFYGAPVVVVVLARKDVRTHVYDGSIVMDNLMLAAESLGISSCWIHRAKEVFETEEGKKILSDLGIAEEYEGIGNCILGYSDTKPEPKPRKENYIFKIQ